MSPHSAYIIQCAQDNFEEAKCVVQMFCKILDIDEQNFSIKTPPLDSTMKRRLDEIGASFWPESAYAAAKSVAGRGL